MGCGSISASQTPTSIPAPSRPNSIYLRQQLIGSGTFGQVYKCLNLLNQEEYALKIVPITAKTKEEALKQINMLKQEIKVLKKLQHPNIVKYYSFEIGNNQKEVEIVLQYAQKGCLKDILKQRGGLPEEEARGMMSQIMAGLSYLHGLNVVHRDLKCANILVMDDGTLKITDFGTAKHVPTVSTNQAIHLNPSLKGTPYYMAPEVLRKTGHGLPADIWSLGCLLIEILSGLAPWLCLTTDFKEIVGYIHNGIRPPYPKGITDECQDFLGQCLKSVPGERMTVEQLMGHRWITKAKKQATPLTASHSKPTVSNSKPANSHLKTAASPYYEQLSPLPMAAQSGQSRLDKMRQIDNYLMLRSKDKKLSRKKRKDGESAKYKKDRTNGIVCSDDRLDGLEQVEVVRDYDRKVSRKLFGDQQQRQNVTRQSQKTGKIYNTAPHVKLPQSLLAQLPPHEREALYFESDLPSKPPSVMAMTQTPSLIQVQPSAPGPRQQFIDTTISREERARFLQQQRILNQQRQEERRRWQRQLKQGANYLRKEINSRYQM